MTRSYRIVITLFLFLINIYLTGEDHIDKKSGGHSIIEYTIGRIGFVQNFVSDNPESEDEVSIGIESYN